MKTKRIFSAIITITLILTAGSLYAFDYGGSLIASVGYSSAPGIGFTNDEALGMWLETEMGEHFSFEMKLDLAASFSSRKKMFYINPDYLKIDGLWDDIEGGPSITALSIGRFSTSDFTSRVFSQSLDGIILNLNYPNVELTIAAGYTGFFFSQAGGLKTPPSASLSKTDVFYRKANSTSLFEYAGGNTGDKTILSSPRAVEIITLTFEQLFLKQNLTLSVVAQEDMQPVVDKINSLIDKNYNSPLISEGETTYYNTKGGAFDSQYIGLGISGPSISSLYHSIYYYLGTGRTLSYAADSDSPTGRSYQYKTIISHMAGFSLDYFMPWLFNSKVGTGLVFGSGDSDAVGVYEGNREGYYTQFTPITGGGGGMLFASGISNMIIPNLNFSIKPLKNMDNPHFNNFQIALTYMPFFRALDGPAGASAGSGISANYSGNYLGSEIDLIMGIRPFSDLGIVFQGGFLIPDASAFKGSAIADPSFAAKLSVSMSF